jgi:predicted RNase H-like HicB family nuclease
MDPSKSDIDELAGLPYKTYVKADNCGDHPCFVAYHDDLPGCMAQGGTWREAIHELSLARRDYIAASL